jgi:hypothetical protein
MSSSASSVSRPSFQVGAVTGRPGSAGVQNGSRYLKICLYAGPALAYKSSHQRKRMSDMMHEKQHLDVRYYSLQTAMLTM